MIAIRTKRIQVLLSTGVGKHIQVHSRSNKNRRFSRKISRNQHIIGYAVRHFSDGRSRGRGYQHSIRPQSQVYMAIPRTVTLSKEFTDDRFAGQRRESYRSDKFFSGGSNYDLYLSSLFDQATYDVTSFIGSYATGNTEYNFLSVQHNYFPVNSRRRILVNMAFVFNVKSLFRIQL